MYSSLPRKRKASEQVVPGIDDIRDPAQLRRRPSHESTNSTPSNPFDGPDYPIPDFQRVYSLMRHPTNGLSLADRRWRLCTYSNCFVGKEAVEWIVENLKMDTAAAISIGQRLMDAGIIHHVASSEPFSDGYFFYCFQEDDDSKILNMKRGWDRAIPTRHAVEVAKTLLTNLAFLCEEHRKNILAVKKSPDPSPSTPKLSDPSITQKSISLPSTPKLAQVFTAVLSYPFVPALTSHVAALTSPNISSPTLPLLTGTVGDDVDYSTLAKSEEFRQYTLAAAELQCVQLVALDDEERIAFFVNVYNALCLHAHVTQGPPDTMLRRWFFFRIFSYRVAGLDMTLDDIEHGILRGNKRPPMLRFIQQLRASDPKCQHMLTKRNCRIHFVISAGTTSDPPIRILDGENVQEQLHEATVEFLSYSVKVDTERRKVTLPRIFMWYAEDFESPEKNLLLWVAKYLSPETSNQLVLMATDEQNPPIVTYENFDWSNAQARFEASAVRRKRKKLEREASEGLQPAIDVPFPILSPDLTNPFQPTISPQTTWPAGNNNQITASNMNIGFQDGLHQIGPLAAATPLIPTSNLPQRQSDAESAHARSSDLLSAAVADSSPIAALAGDGTNNV